MPSALAAARRMVLLALATLAFAGLALVPAGAQDAPRTVAAGITYEPIGRWEVERLNAILTTDAPAFTGVAIAATPATAAVRLFRVTYTSVIPEQGNRPTVASGLLAVPDGASGPLPLLSYQHGTVYGKEEVPSFPEKSPETQLVLAQFAGQGYAVVAADYFGMGTSPEPEGYMVKRSHQLATVDMLSAGRFVLADLGIATDRLVLAGWSQGGFVTMALLEALEAAEIPVDAAATASAPVDIAVALNGFLAFPRPIDAPWTTTLFILSAFAFEEYYGIPGLARALFLDEAYDVARRAYLREPLDPKDVPTDLRALIRPDYFDPAVFARSAYGRLVAETNAYRWIIETPVRNHFGEADEVITPGLGRLAATYQAAIGAGNTRVEAVSTGDTDHRGTFGTAVPKWKAWFDALP
jgi:dienelactone hydrolase